MKGKRIFLLPLLLFGACLGPRRQAIEGGAIVTAKESEPAPLLTADFGIVTDNDRAKNRRKRIPFLPAPEDNYYYWQCLKVDKVSVGCIGVDVATSGMGCRRYSCLPEVSVTSDGSHYAFLAHKGWCLESFREFRSRFRRLLRGQKIACFGGEYVGEEPVEGNERRNSEWFLKAVKTRRGKWSYFAD